MAKRWQNEHKKRGATRDGDNIVYERDENKVPVGTFYRGLNLVAYKIGTYVDYYLYDQKGSVTGGANRTGTTEYDAFGVQRTSDKLPYNPFRYNGEYYDQESGLIYLRNRYYDPATGRFMTEDPAKDGLNWYVYCGNNPVNFVDPLGLWMDGDEKLSRPAQFYLHYYTRVWDLAKHSASGASVILGQSDLSEEERVRWEQVEQEALQEMERAHMLAEDIRAKAVNGGIESLYYEVPLYIQNDKPLCQEYAAVMVENAGVENPLDQAGADIRAMEIFENGWDTVIAVGINLKNEDVNYESLYSALTYGPQRADYYINNKQGHTVTLTGVFRADGHADITATLNPQGVGEWGNYRVQTINEFKRWYLEDDYPEGGAMENITVWQKRY